MMLSLRTIPQDGVAIPSLLWMFPYIGEIPTPLRPQARFERNRRRRLLARDVKHWLGMTPFFDSLKSTLWGAFMFS